MSSSYAIDSAWSLLQNDDKIEKILPLAALAVPALMGAYGAYTGAGGRFRDDQGNFDLNMGGNAKMVDPLTGGFIGEKKLGSSFGDRLLGGAVGATQAINPFGTVRGAAALTRGAGAAVGKLGARKIAPRLAARGRAKDKVLLDRRIAEAAGDTAPLSAFKPITTSPAVPQGYKTFTHPTTGQTRSSLVPAQPAQVLTPQMQRQASLDSGERLTRDLFRPSRTTEAAQGLQRWGQSPTKFTPNMKQYAPMDRTALKVGNKMAFLGRATQFGGPVAGALVGLGFDKLSDDMTVDPDTSGFGGYGGASSGFGSGQYGMGAQGAGAGGFGGADNFSGVDNQNSNLTDRRKIWTGEEDTEQYSGQIATGENMKIGERMLKQAENMMYKAVCSACGKKDCVGKAHCGTLKADDKKKPAHGMVIVIGTKAGPGPSKDGKREKLDSEKDKKDE